MTAKLRNVHVRVNDAATGQPTPVRIRCADRAGRSYPPLGYLADFATESNQDVGGNLLLAGKPYAYIWGSCEVPLPSGPITVEISKGPEYLPQHQEVTLGVGQLSLRCTIERWTDWRREGWYSGDMRCHYLTPHAALLEAAAEDLAVVNLLACETASGGRRSISNLLAFSGQRPSLEAPGHLVAVNTHNRHAQLGSLGLLHTHRVVHPLHVDGTDASEEWTLADWCDQCHRKRGLTVWTDPLSLRSHPGSSFGEALADLILGKIDAVELSAAWSLEDYVQHYWYPLLNGGLRVPLVGSSGKDSNVQASGAWRTYVRLLPEQAFTYSNWIDAVRAGRTFVTNGPLVSFTVNGQDPGAILDLSSLDQPVEIAAELRSVAPFESMEVLLNGQVLRQVPATGSPFSATLHLALQLPAPGWLAVRCLALRDESTHPSAQGLAAHSSPVYVQLGGRKPSPDPTAVLALVGELDPMLAWTRSLAGGPRHRLSDTLQLARRTLSGLGGAGAGADSRS